MRQHTILLSARDGNYNIEPSSLSNEPGIIEKKTSKMKYLTNKLKQSFAQSFSRDKSYEEEKKSHDTRSENANHVDSGYVMQTEHSNDSSSTRQHQETFDAEMSCIELQISSKITENRDKRKLIYVLKISDVDRYQLQNQYSGQKIFEWSNQRSQKIKFAFKFKYVKSEIVFEVMSIADTSQQKKKYADSVQPRDLLYRAQFNFEDVLQSKNKPVDPNLVEYTNDF